MRRRFPILLLAFAALCCGLASTSPLRAHQLDFTDSLLVLKKDGTFQLDLVCDLDALALGVSPTVDSALLAAEIRGLDAADRGALENRLRRSFERRVRVLFDGEPAAFSVFFPQRGTSLAEEAEIPTVLGVVARLEGRIPGAPQAVQVRASRAFPPLRLTVLHQETTSGRHELLEQGAESTLFPVSGVPAETDGSALSQADLIGRYGVLGFLHIVPRGLDHILFVLGLFLLSSRFRPLLFQVTAFTLAHAVTLALATYGLVRLPSSIVEPVIALSIVWIGVENVLGDELKPWRPAVVFLFGLLHGLGFAGVLAELGLPEGEWLPALVSFNVGIEIGQLAVLGLAFLAVGWARDRPWYRSRITVPLSLGIAAVGLFWAIERILGG